MADPPKEYLVEIVGTKTRNEGCSCQNHRVCGEALQENSVVRFRTVSIKGRQETAIAAYLLSAGTDSCRVGFLPKRFVPFEEQFNGKLAQVILIDRLSNDRELQALSRKNCGFCLSVVISQNFDSSKVTCDQISIIKTNDQISIIKTD